MTCPIILDESDEECFDVPMSPDECYPANDDGGNDGLIIYYGDPYTYGISSAITFATGPLPRKY